MKKTTLSVHVLSHFCTDFVCFVLLFGPLAAALDDAALLSVAFLIYNLIAFGLQPLFGYLYDVKKFKHPAPCGLGLLIIAVALAVSGRPSLVYAAVGIAALGNACYHVGGGADVLRGSDGKIAPSGLFVASGAPGVALGTLCGKTAGFPLWLALLPPLVCIGLLVWVQRKNPRAAYADTPADFARLARPSLSFAGVLILALAAVFVRAWVGSVVPAEWKSGTLPALLVALLPACAAFAGKAAGGLLADRLGARRVSLIALLASLPLLLFLDHWAAFALIGLFLFNLVMPVTLCACTARLPRFPGLAFGLTTLALLLGVLPLWLLPLEGLAARLVPAGLILLAAGCLFGLMPADKRKDRA